MERGIARDKDFTGRSAEAVAKVIRENLQSTTKEFTAIKVIVVPPFERAAQKNEAVIKGIRKVRHITLRGPGDLLAREVPCLDCMDNISKVCASCALLPASYKRQPEDETAAIQGEDETAAIQPEDETAAVQGEDEGAAEVEEESLTGVLQDPFGLVTEQDRADAEEEDEEEVKECEDEPQAESGDVRWAQERRGLYWPCQVVPYDSVPAAVVRKFGVGYRSNISWVKLFGRGRGGLQAPPPLVDPPARREHRVRRGEEGRLSRQGAQGGRLLRGGPGQELHVTCEEL